MEKPDDGCAEATAELGRPSHCLECPFPQGCVFDSIRRRSAKLMKRDQEIIDFFKRGQTAEELAARFGLSHRQINRVLKLAGEQAR